jgi:hypothetical protein
MNCGPSPRVRDTEVTRARAARAAQRPEPLACHSGPNAYLDL